MNEQAQEQENKPSIQPSIIECERFFKFLNQKFNLNLKNDLIVLIHETHPSVKGYFRSVRCQKIWKDNTAFKQQSLNSIVLSSHTLQSEPYETLTHELAHYVNFINNIQDCSKSGKYHNQKFKAQAEKLLLKVEKFGSYGFAFTSMTEEFKQMLNEFKPNETAFKLFQELPNTKEKQPTRLLLYMCDCGCKIRTARNQDKPLIAICQYCNTQFNEVKQ